MTIANRLTLLRMVLAFGVIGLILVENFYAHLAALILFWLAGLTDWVDGYIARKTGSETNFGKMADPLADKILVAGVLIAFVKVRSIWVPAWVPFLVIVREFVIMGLRTLAAFKGKILAADRWGKTKTVVQIAGISLMLIYHVARPSLNPGTRASLDHWPYYIAVFMVVATWASGIVYLRKNWRLLSDSW